eukprot:7417612-Pyramimonas_sp.AAC.1
MLAKFLQHLPHPPTNYEDALARHSLPDTPAQTFAQRTLNISPNVQSQTQTGICRQGTEVLRHQTDKFANGEKLANPTSGNDEMDTTLCASPLDRHSTSGSPLGGAPNRTTSPPQLMKYRERVKDRMDGEIPQLMKYREQVDDRLVGATTQAAHPGQLSTERVAMLASEQRKIIKWLDTTLRALTGYTTYERILFTTLHCSSLRTLPLINCTTVIADLRTYGRLLAYLAREATWSWLRTSVVYMSLLRVHSELTHTHTHYSACTGMHADDDESTMDTPLKGNTALGEEEVGKPPSYSPPTGQRNGHRREAPPVDTQMDHSLAEDTGHEGVPTHVGSCPSVSEDGTKMRTGGPRDGCGLSLIHISEPTRPEPI